MDEHRIVELLTRKIAGEASPEELGELSYLLTKYPDSVYYEALLEQVWDLGKQEAAVDVKEAYKRQKHKFKDELKFKKTTLGFRGFIKKPAVLAVTVSCICFALAAFILDNYTQPAKRANIEIKAGKGVRKEIRLPDGTIVRLNSDSKISYDPDMLDNDQRELRLTGEAYFNVAHDKEHAFVVTTNKVAVRVLGTEFNVKEYPDETNSETTLLKGSIELSINSRSEQKFLLKPSEKFALVQKNRISSKKDNNSVLMIENISPVKFGDKEYIREISWVENKLVFQNESFEDLIPKLERWYNVKIDLDDPKIRSVRFTGIFIDENIIQALEAMQLIKPFNYKLTANEVKIY